MLYNFGGRNAALLQPVHGARYAAAFLQEHAPALINETRLPWLTV